jgi:TolA-binding protein
MSLRNGKKMLLAWGALLALAAVFWIAVSPSLQRVDENQARQALTAGIDLFDQKKFAEAIDALSSVPPGSDYAARARYYEGASYIEIRDFDSAVETLQQALERTPKDPGILFALGVASYKNGKINLAKAYFSSVVDIEPMDDRQRELREQARGLVDVMASVERMEGEGQVVPSPAHGAGRHKPTGPDPEDAPRGGE